MQKKLIFLLGSVFAGLIVILCYRLPPKRGLVTPLPPFQATSILNGVRITRYSTTKNQTLIYTIEATRVEGLALEEMSLLANPNVGLLGQDGVELGRIHAQYAILLAQETLYLSGGVRIAYHDAERRLYTIQAESAYCSLTTQSFSAGKPVTSRHAGITAITEQLSGTF